VELSQSFELVPSGPRFFAAGGRVAGLEVGEVFMVASRIETPSLRRKGARSVESDIERLGSLVQRFSVCWDTWPEETSVQHLKRQIAFALELCGTHEAGVEHPNPRCPHCQLEYAALKQIAAWILPREKRDSDYDISDCAQSIRYLPAHSNRPDVSLTIRILRRHGFNEPEDACEKCCLQEMEQRLLDLGVRRESWPTEGNQGAAKVQLSGRVQ
jgi:hypothetical protein